MPSPISITGGKRIEPKNKITNLSIVTNGLVLYLDPGNPKCYPGTPTGNESIATWMLYDISPRGNHWYIYGGPVFESGSVTFDGTNDTFQESSPYGFGGANNSRTNRYRWNTFINQTQWSLTVNPSTSNVTIEFWVRINDTLSQKASLLGSTLNSQGSLLYNGIDSPGKFVWTWDDSSTSDTYATNKTVAVGEWIQLVLVLRAGYYFTYYVNGVLDKAEMRSTDLAATNATAWLIGLDYGLNTYLKCSLGPIRWYNRILSDNEILANFNATKSKFGLQ